MPPSWRLLFLLHQICGRRSVVCLYVRLVVVMVSILGLKCPCASKYMLYVLVNCTRRYVTIPYNNNHNGNVLHDRIHINSFPDIEHVRQWCMCICHQTPNQAHWLSEYFLKTFNVTGGGWGLDKPNDSLMSATYKIYKISNTALHRTAHSVCVCVVEAYYWPNSILYCWNCVRVCAKWKREWAV